MVEDHYRALAAHHPDVVLVQVAPVEHALVGEVPGTTSDSHPHRPPNFTEIFPESGLDPNCVANPAFMPIEVTVNV